MPSKPLFEFIQPEIVPFDDTQNDVNNATGLSMAEPEPVPKLTKKMTSKPKELAKNPKFAKKTTIRQAANPEPVKVDREPTEEEVMMMMLQKMQEN